jgi:hypothetical protein
MSWLLMNALDWQERVHPRGMVNMGLFSRLVLRTNRLSSREGGPSVIV